MMWRGMSWRGIAMLLLLVAAVVTGWAVWNQRSKDQALAAPPGQPDYVLEDFELVALDEQGRESFTLRAPRLARDPSAKTMDIVTPLFLIPAGKGSQGGPWEVRSKTGWVSADGDELRLRGNVVADSTGADGRPVKMASQQLNVFPKAKRATSAVAVTLTRPGLTIHGRELEAHLDSKRVLLQDTKTRYESSAR